MELLKSSAYHVTFGYAAAQSFPFTNRAHLLPARDGKQSCQLFTKRVMHSILSISLVLNKFLESLYRYFVDL